MTNKKKTFYEILALSPNASHQDIQANHESLLANIKSQKKHFNPDEYNLKLKIINLAFETLSDPASRAAYDAKLAIGTPPASGSASSNALALPPDASTIALRAEAISLRAEAISLRADALSIKTVGTDLNSRINHPGFGQTNTLSPIPIFKKFIMVLGSVVAAWMIIHVLFLLTTKGRTHVNAEMAAKAEEKLIIQEYYQTHGVKASSRAEVERLEAENRRQENERRTAERERERQEENTRRFEQESRQRAEEVSEKLRYAEEQARQRAEREDEQKKWQEEEKKRRSEEAEYARIEREKERWRETLRR